MASFEGESSLLQCTGLRPYRTSVRRWLSVSPEETPHQNQTMLVPWFWISSPQNCEKSFCCLNHSVYGVLLWQARQTKIVTKSNDWNFCLKGKLPFESCTYMHIYKWCSWKERICQCRRQSLGWEDPLEEGVATHSSILAWRIPWTKKPDGLHGVAKSGTLTEQLTQTQRGLFTRWRTKKEVASSPVSKPILNDGAIAGYIQGLGILLCAGCSISGQVS